MYVRPPQTIILPFCISFSSGCFWLPPPVQYYETLSIVLQALCLPLTKRGPLEKGMANHFSILASKPHEQLKRQKDMTTEDKPPGQ